MRWLWLLAVAAAGLALSGCNAACQTYCDSITDFYLGCVVDPDQADSPEDLTWQNLGARDEKDYWEKCHDRFERTLLIARVQDRNLIYDWCAEASLAVAGASRCADLELPPPLDILNQDEDTGGGDAGLQ